MGTDIHPAIERRDTFDDGEPTGWWQLAGVPDRERNYDFFGALANVRRIDEYAPLTQDRGLPENTDYSTRAVLSDQHSAGWCELSELRAYDVSALPEHAAVIFARWLTFGEFVRDHWKLKDGDVRFVWDFDS